MNNINIGIANLIIKNKIKNSYFNDNFLNESKKIVNNFFDILKNSPILQLEFNVYNNLNDKYISNDIAATRYIDNNIKKFEIYTIDEVLNEHNKLNFIISENQPIPNDPQIILFNAINTLIIESLKNPDDIDVDAIHESFTCVLNHIKTPKTLNSNSNIIENYEINDDIINIAITKFNERYNNLNENDISLIKKLVYADALEKQNILEEYKNETLNILNSLNNEAINENINIAKQKIIEMKFDINTVDDNIINLYTLKNNLYTH